MHARARVCGDNGADMNNAEIAAVLRRVANSVESNYYGGNGKVEVTVLIQTGDKVRIVEAPGATITEVLGRLVLANGEILAKFHEQCVGGSY